MVKGSQDTEIAHVTRIEVIRTHQRYVDNNERPAHKASTSKFKELRSKCLRADVCDDKTLSGRLATSKMANELSQLQQDVILRAGDGWISPRIILDHEKMPSDEEKADDRIPPQITSDDDSLPFDDQEVNERIPPHKLPDYDVFTCEYKDGNNLIPPREIPDDDVVPSEDHKGV